MEREVTNWLIKIKFDEYLSNKDNLIFIEWPSIVEDEELRADIDIYFEYSDDMNDRVIRIQ